jgi:hypothetical protein
MSYTEAGFLTGSGVILGQVPAYGDDAGFFYDWDQDRYIQVEEDGFIISYTEAGFLTGSGSILGQVPAYGDDAGFMYVAAFDPNDPDRPDPSQVPLPASGVLFGVLMAALWSLRMTKRA